MAVWMSILDNGIESWRILINFQSHLTNSQDGSNSSLLNPTPIKQLISTKNFTI